jgi:hypothetical protein
LLLLIKVGHQLCAPLIRTKRSKLYNHFNLVHRLELLRDRLVRVNHLTMPCRSDMQCSTVACRLYLCAHSVP